MSSALFGAARGLGRALASRAAASPALRQQVRNEGSNGYIGNVVIIPCRNKTSTPELVMLGSVMLACWLAIPTWVLLHIRDYNGTRDAPPPEPLQ